MEPYGSVREGLAGRDAPGFGFNRSVPSNGYRWWYVDALSDDERHALTVIAFIGSVFSPYYAWARRRGPTDPLEHCAMNVALYTDTGKRWTMTERGRKRVQGSANALLIGPSALAWHADTLRIEIDEITVPLPARLRGEVRVQPLSILNRCFDLDPEGSHRWHPIAPRARVEVAFERPALRWTGTGYLDSNSGDVPLEETFTRWDWSRAELRAGDTAVLYDVSRRNGGELSLALCFDKTGSLERFNPPPRVALPNTGWHIARGTRAENTSPASVRRTLEDTPFYARSILTAPLLGERVTAVHESLNLDRFRSAWVQMLLPFRMPRRAF